MSANGRVALTGSEHMVRYWDAASAREIRQYVGHGGIVRAVDFHPKLQQAVSVAADNTARIWDLGGIRLLRIISGIPGTPQGVAFSPDGKSILVYGPGVLGTWDAVTGKQLQTFETPTKGRRRTRTVNLSSDVSAAWAPNGAVVTAVAGAVTLHDPETWDEVLQFSAPPAFVYAVGVSADGRTVVAAGRGLSAWQLDKPLVPAAPEPPTTPAKDTPPAEKSGR
jgi:WD40 repeat protein